MIELKCLDDYDEIVEYKYDSAKELSGEYWKDSIDIDVPSNDSRVVELKVDGRVVENMAYFSDVVNYLGIDKENSELKSNGVHKLMEFEIKDDVYEVYGDYQPDYSTVFEPDVIGSVLMNGDKMQSFGKTWTDVVLDEKDFLGMAIAAYVNDDTNVRFTEMCEEIESFKDNVQTYTHEVNGRKIPNTVVTHMGDALDLVALSETGGYYANGTLSVATRTDGSIATDVEAFVENALEEDYEQGKMIYMSKEVKEYLQELVGDMREQETTLTEQERIIIEGLESIKEEASSWLYDGDTIDDIRAGDVNALNKVMDIIKNPQSMKSLEKKEMDDLLFRLVDLKEHSKSMAREDERIGVMDSPWKDDALTLDKARNFIETNYRAYQAEEPREDMRKQEMTDVNEVVDGKEITNVTRLEPAADFIVEYNQDGVRSGRAVCSIDYLDCYDGDKTEDKAIVLDMVKDGTLELPDLMKRPHYSDVSPALLYFYDEVCKREFDDQYFLESDLEALSEKDKRFQGKTPQDILDEIEADMILYPSLANYIEIDPYTDGDKDIEFYDSFRESITESCNKNRDCKHLPVHNDIPGEVIFQEVECALKKVENEVGEDLDFKEAITHCSGISPHDVLLSLKHEAESTRVRRGNTVLFGTMKYETQKDRKDAYKWAKSWMNKSAKRLNYEIYKKQEKGKGQGR